MFARIEGLPEGAIGVAAQGRITGADRETVLGPVIDSTLEKNGKVKLLYVAGADFAGYDRGALFDDAIFGTRHFTAFAKIAFVADKGPYERAAQALDGLMPGALRVFPTRDLEAAKEWLAE
jgi:hypothetical protein